MTLRFESPLGRSKTCDPWSFALQDTVVCNNEKLTSGGSAAYVTAGRQFMTSTVFKNGTTWPSAILAPSVIQRKPHLNSSIKVGHDQVLTTSLTGWCTIPRNVCRYARTPAVKCFRHSHHVAYSVCFLEREGQFTTYSGLRRDTLSWATVVFAEKGQREPSLTIVSSPERRKEGQESLSSP